MDTADTVAPIKKQRGRPKKVDKATPLGEYIAEQAKEARESKKNNTVVEKYYEYQGTKLSLCKKMKSGTVHKVFVGSTNDKENGAQIRTFIEKVKAEGRLRMKV